MDYPFSFIPGTYYNWGNKSGPRDLYNVMGQQASMLDDSMREWAEAIATFKSMPKFDANRAKRDVDSAFSMSTAMMPGVSSNLKGMGVGAAEGTAQLQQSLPLMQARGQAYGDLSRDAVNANMAWLSQLANMMTGKQNTMFQGFNAQRALQELINNIKLND